MSRKDTIIIAVLVNAGLLVVLFASALKSNKEETHLVQKSQYEMRQEPKEVAPPLFAHQTANDEVDQVLKQYSQPVATSMDTQAPSNTASVGSTSEIAAASSDGISTSPKLEIPPSFAEEIRALSESQGSSTVAAAPSAQSHGEYIEVRVQKGDVLDKIARKYRVKVEEIMQINQLKTSSLSIGQVLKVPASGRPAVASAPVKKAAAPAKAATGAKYYIVKAGDSPWSIASKNHIKVDDLLRLNNLTTESAKKLKAGQKLRVQ